MSWRAFAYRDAAVVLVTATAWLLLPQQELGGYLIGALTTVCTFLGHEWGHVAGAHLSRAKIGRPRHLYSPFLYNFDSSVNNRRQFLHTSHCGFLVTALALFAIYLLPGESTAIQSARWGIGALAAATVIFEFPIYLWVAAGGRLPSIHLVQEDRS